MHQFVGDLRSQHNHLVVANLRVITCCSYPIGQLLLLKVLIGSISLLDLRDELNRLVDQNGKMADALNLLQMEVVALRGENADLHTTVRHLHSEVRRLRRAGATSDFGELDVFTPN